MNAEPRRMFRPALACSMAIAAIGACGGGADGAVYAVNNAVLFSVGK
ncbi:MAG: hypothetical protein ABI671_15325 [Burkholderiales bacterium]